mmetsp:Transcript_9865/g.29276  ORF Transcript_9865/g.29276 Transcript_9865/m.29276 type:complete len:233 (+) Transcript_9865:112-810(+)
MRGPIEPSLLLCLPTLARTAARAPSAARHAGGRQCKRIFFTLRCGARRIATRRGAIDHEANGCAICNSVCGACTGVPIRNGPAGARNAAAHRLARGRRQFWVSVADAVAEDAGEWRHVAAGGAVVVFDDGKCHATEMSLELGCIERLPEQLGDVSRRVREGPAPEGGQDQIVDGMGLRHAQNHSDLLPGPVLEAPPQADATICVLNQRATVRGNCDDADRERLLQKRVSGVF